MKFGYSKHVSDTLSIFTVTRQYLSTKYRNQFLKNLKNYLSILVGYSTYTYGCFSDTYPKKYEV